jgi:hypothetical protein
MSHCASKSLYNVTSTRLGPTAAGSLLRNKWGDSGQSGHSIATRRKLTLFRSVHGMPQPTAKHQSTATTRDAREPKSFPLSDRCSSRVAAQIAGISSAIIPQEMIPTKTRSGIARRRQGAVRYSGPAPMTPILISCRSSVTNLEVTSGQDTAVVAVPATCSNRPCGTFRGWRTPRKLLNLPNPAIDAIPVCA